MPLSGDLSRLHVTVSRRFLEKLEAARAALSHSHPGTGAAEILEAGLDLLLERHAKRRGLLEKPRRNPPPSNPEHIPAHVKRAVSLLQFRAEPTPTGAARAERTRERAPVTATARRARERSPGEADAPGGRR